MISALIPALVTLLLIVISAHYNTKFNNQKTNKQKNIFKMMQFLPLEYSSPSSESRFNQTDLACQHTIIAPHHTPKAPHYGPPHPPPGLKPPHHGPPHPPEQPDLKEKRIYTILFIILLEVVCVLPLILLNQRDISIIIVFIITMVTIFIRPSGINEAYISSVGAGIVLLTGVVSYPNILDITEKIGGSSITIIATIVMAVVLESFGFFYWAAAKLSSLAKGSGYRLFWYIMLLCFIMTLLFNNDGSILITTPILILLLTNLNLKPHQQIPYLLSGALIATGSSVPIGVSNIVNLISLKIVNISLYEYTAMMFVPGVAGLLFMSLLLFLLLKGRCPRIIPLPDMIEEGAFFKDKFCTQKGKFSFENQKTRTVFMLKILAFVFGIRCSLFIASYFNIPIEAVAILGSIVLLALRWYYFRTDLKDIIRKTPYHILIFAFTMYIIIYGLNNIGLTEFLTGLLKPIVSQGIFNASFTMGGLVSLMSNIFNNHPALMVGTLTLQNMRLDLVTMKMIYLASIIGSDIGSLLLPIGTLASLLWMHILKENKINIPWSEYIRVTVIVIPLTVIFTLFLLYYWFILLFL